MPVNRLILQAETSAEVRACLMAASMASPPVPVLRASLTTLPDVARLIAAGVAAPVGSVEFVRAAMAAAGIQEPEPMSYPVELLRFCGREIKQRRAGEVIGTCFVKPVRTKLFSGFVFDTMTDPDSLTPHDREQYDAFMALEPSEPVWISEVVRFQSEWRYYVDAGKVLGKARYDAEGDAGAPEPDEGTVAKIISSLPFDHPCAVDVGVLGDGSTALVEVNDAWAIGFYQDAMPAKDYMAYLVKRWESIRSAGLTVTA